MPRGNDGKIFMPGPLDDCTPTVFIDRIRLEDATARDIDEFVQPGAIAGMEVYTRASQVPPQFASLTSCGAIVIWTRVPPKKP